MIIRVNVGPARCARSNGEAHVPGHRKIDLFFFMTYTVHVKNEVCGILKVKLTCLNDYNVP